MNIVKYAIFTGLVLAFTNAQALVNVYKKSANATRMLLSEKTSAAAPASSNQRIYLAGMPRGSEKIATRTTEDGDTITKKSVEKMMLRLYIFKGVRPDTVLITG